MSCCGHRPAALFPALVCWRRSAEPPPHEAAQTIMRIAGHVSRAMLSRYSHVRMEAKRWALDEIGTPARRRREAQG